MKRALIIAGLIALAYPAIADEIMKVDAMKTFTPESLKWGDDPSLPKGGQVALLLGDPSKPEVFVALVKLPAKYIVPPHTHPKAELITILSGSMGNAMGEKFDDKKGEVLKAGASFALPANHAHYVWTGEQETILELVATGPWGLTYINPADDPRNQAQQK